MGSPGDVVKHANPSRQQGSFIVEAMIALAVFSVGVLGLFTSVQKVFLSAADDRTRDQAAAALQDVADALRNSSFSKIYASYNNAKFPAYGLTIQGGAATVLIQCDVNELSLPAEYGPVQDLDGDGFKKSSDVSASYVLLPVRLTLTYQTNYGTRTDVRYLLIGGN
jgi:hypothetical protein